MNPKLMAWALGLSVAANVAAVACWPRGRESEGQAGRFTFIHAPGSYMRGDTLTGQLVMAGVVEGKMQRIEVISAQNLPAGWTLPLRAP